MCEPMNMPKPIYKIRRRVLRKKVIYEIIKPNGKSVNDAIYDSELKAKRYLRTLIAFGYCKRESTSTVHNLSETI